MINFLAPVLFSPISPNFVSMCLFVRGAVIWSWSFGQNRKQTVKIRHYNINILFIYSEQWPRSRNRKWPNDLDQMTTWL